MTPSEDNFFNRISERCDVIFDIGASWSTFLNKKQEVHYFEPCKASMEALKNSPTNNSKSVFNCYGLSDESSTVPLYNTGALYDRSIRNAQELARLGVSNHIVDNVSIKRADEYIAENNIQKIDFVKIDVEGLEYKVLKGFGDKLNIVKFIQFEYGTGLSDAGYKLIDIVNLLKQYNFTEFYYITDGDPLLVQDYTDNWQWCNIVSFNSKLANSL
jgi:FkbM family methyltransferase